MSKVEEAKRKLTLALSSAREVDRESAIHQAIAALDAIANKATEEGELPKFPSAICSLVVDDAGNYVEAYRVGDKVYSEAQMRSFALEAIAADRASRQVANKAEVELSDDAIYDFWLYRDCMPAIQAGDMKAQFVSAVRALLAATPPATTGASTALRPTDDELWDETLRDRDAYHDWADKLAEAIAKHFGVDIGEHSNQNLPWAEALEAIESAESVAASTVLTDERIKQIAHERDCLATAIADAAVKAGICRANASLNGPLLIQLCDDMAEVAAQAGQVAVPTQAQIEWGHDLQATLIGASKDEEVDEDARQVMAQAACLLAELTGRAAPSPAKESK